MTPLQFENYLISLTDEQHDILVQERIARLDPNQQLLAQERELQKKYQLQLMKKAVSSEATEDDQEAIYNALREGTDYCEHMVSIHKHCFDCGKIDHTMFPELFNEFGDRIQEN
jgi:hypothetical protein